MNVIQVFQGMETVVPVRNILEAYNLGQHFRRVFDHSIIQFYGRQDNDYNQTPELIVEFPLNELLQRLPKDQYEKIDAGYIVLKPQSYPQIVELSQ